MNFPIFLPLLISNLIPLWSKNIFCMILTRLNLLSCFMASGLPWRVSPVLEKDGHRVFLAGGGEGRRGSRSRTAAKGPVPQGLGEESGPGAHTAPHLWNFSDQEGVSGLQRGRCCV